MIRLYRVKQSGIQDGMQNDALSHKTDHIVLQRLFLAKLFLGLSKSERAEGDLQFGCHQGSHIVRIQLKIIFTRLILMHIPSDLPGDQLSPPQKGDTQEGIPVHR